VCTSRCWVPEISGVRLYRDAGGLTFLSVDGLSKDFSHIQQPCFFSRGRGPDPSGLAAREEAEREVLAQALRIDCVISELVADDEEEQGRDKAPGNEEDVSDGALMVDESGRLMQKEDNDGI
jgi:hypothetical protein